MAGSKAEDAPDGGEVAIQVDVAADPGQAETEDVCVICLSEPATNRLEPCGHLVACDNPACLGGVAAHGKCPLCRVPAANVRNHEGNILLKIAALLQSASSSVGRSAGDGGDGTETGGAGGGASGSSRRDPEFGAAQVGNCFCMLGLAFPIIVLFLSQFIAISYMKSRIGDPDTVDTLDAGIALKHALQVTAGAIGAAFGVFLVLGAIRLAALRGAPRAEREDITLWVKLPILLGCLVGILTAPIFTVAAIADVPVVNVYVMAGIWIGCKNVESVLQVSLKGDAEDWRAEEPRSRRRKAILSAFIGAGFSILTAYLTYYVLFEKRAVIKDPYGVARIVSIVFGATLVSPLVPVLPFLFPAVFMAA